MISRHILFMLLISICIANTSLAKDIDVIKYGAVGDGLTLNSKAIQTAIDDCSKSGGGKVILPAGKWLCGTILLKNGVVLSLDEKAVLLGSTRIEDYFIVDGFTDGTGQQMGYCFVGAVDVKNVGIEGKGTIDGQGKLVQAANGKIKRPFLIRFVRCERVDVQGLHLQASTAWTMHVFRCKNVKIEGVTIFSRGLANNDGIDIDCCENVAIKNCDITSDDDAICFKTTSPYPCTNITVSDIKVRTNCAAVKFGTESTGDFKNIQVSNIKISYAGLGAVKILSVDGAHISNIEIFNIKGDTVNVPIMIRLGARLKIFRPGDVKKETGTISNVSISNVKIKNALTTGILVAGIPGHSINGLSVKNVEINSAGGGTFEDAQTKLAENIAAYPEVRMFGKTIPSYGLYVRHANNLSFENISFTTDMPDARPAAIADDVKNINLTAWKLPVTSSAGALVSLVNVNQASLKVFQLTNKPTLFLSVEGTESRNIRLQKLKSLEDKNVIRLGNNVDKNAVINE